MTDSKHHCIILSLYFLPLTICIVNHSRKTLLIEKVLVRTNSEKQMQQCPFAGIDFLLKWQIILYSAIMFLLRQLFLDLKSTTTPPCKDTETRYQEKLPMKVSESWECFRGSDVLPRMIETAPTLFTLCLTRIYLFKYCSYINTMII